ncbi:hypothetical protein SAMN05421847_1368 [Halpernia humi]|uniref:Uncharacterized protein n=2 Tax=Halpernia humi TaxID=493375 RepID=A0A1H5WXS2_9FLAO|nr:hypothetical protein SAMN05421847_1368 [Halpernia humi]
MLNYFKSISFIFLLGLFLVPTSIDACQKESYQATKELKKVKTHIIATFSKLESSCESGTCIEGCCDKKTKGCGHADCNGNCNVSSCFTGGSGASGTLENFKVQNNNTDLSLLEKSFFFYINSNYLAGIYPIWQPPKI